MKSLAPILIVLFLPFSFNAQEYFPMPTENTEWSIIASMVDPGPMDPSFISITHYSIVGDSIVNDTLYHQVKVSNGGDAFNLENSYGNILYREDENKKVWGRDENEEFIMFDFSLNEGDMFCFYDQPSGVLCHEVYLVDSIEIDGVYRRQIHFEYDGQEDVWVEGIGSKITGLGGPWSFIGNFQTNLICFRQSDIPVFGSCNFPDGISELGIESIGFQLYPNPCESYIQFDFENFDLLSIDLMIYNMLGELVFSGTELNPEGKLDISMLKEGNYSMVVFDKNGQALVSKFQKK